MWSHVELNHSLCTYVALLMVAESNVVRTGGLIEGSCSEKVFLLSPFVTRVGYLQVPIGQNFILV